MLKKCFLLLGFVGFLAIAVHSPLSVGFPPSDKKRTIEQRFSSGVRPFLESYCFSCHGPKKRKGQLDLSRDATLAAVVKNPNLWQHILERLEAGEMPPDNAPKMPTAGERK